MSQNLNSKVNYMAYNRPSKRKKESFHDLKPTIWIRRQGLSETIIDEIRGQIKTRKVIKVKWLQSADVDPQSVADRSKTVLLQVRGRTMVLGDSSHKN